MPRFWVLLKDRAPKLIEMPAIERRLVVEAALLLWLARAGLAWMPLASLRGWLVRLAGTSGTHDSQVHRRQIVGAVARAARSTPFRATCLMEALAAEAMLRRRGYDARLKLGVVHPSDSRLTAHAWVELNGEVLVGGLDTLASYAVLRPRGTS